MQRSDDSDATGRRPIGPAGQSAPRCGANRTALSGGSGSVVVRNRTSAGVRSEPWRRRSSREPRQRWGLEFSRESRALQKGRRSSTRSPTTHSCDLHEVLPKGTASTSESSPAVCRTLGAILRRPTEALVVGANGGMVFKEASRPGGGTRTGRAARMATRPVCVSGRSLVGPARATARTGSAPAAARCAGFPPPAPLRSPRCAGSAGSGPDSRWHRTAGSGSSGRSG